MYATDSKTSKDMQLKIMSVIYIAEGKYRQTFTVIKERMEFYVLQRTL
jgi:hypothetical protein